MMNNFHTQLQQLAAQNQHLQDVIADRRPTPAPTTDTPFSHTGKAHIKFNKPPEFDGRDKKAANAFLTHLQLHFLAVGYLPLYSLYSLPSSLPYFHSCSATEL
jgi:hypothetical protein